MIQGFVNAIKNSIGMKIFLSVALVALAVLGVGDVVQPGMDPNIAINVGNANISASDLQRRYDQSIQQYKRSTGAKEIPPDLQRSILSATVDELTSAATSDAVALEM